MSDSLSIFSFKAWTEEGRARGWRRLGLFCMPYALIGSVLFSSLFYTGEFLPVRYVAWLQSQGTPFIFLTAVSDHNFRLKVEAARQIRPEILAIGPSRANQFRSAMFKPLTFYNAGNSVYVLRDFQKLLEEIGEPYPRVVIFSLDFYFFNNAWDATRGEYVVYDDVAGWGSAEHRTMLSRYIALLRRDPLSLLPLRFDPYSGVPALGMQAARGGKGFRIDGSLQYGEVLRGDIARAGINPVAVDIQRIYENKRPFQFGDRLDHERRRDLENLAAFASRHNVKLIGITMPYAPELTAAMDQSPKHQIWRDFLAPETQEWFRSLGIIHFDFTRLDSFGGNHLEFVDGYHPSETAVVRMLVKMLESPQFVSVLPNLSQERLVEKLKGATTLEVFRNEF